MARRLSRGSRVSRKRSKVSRKRSRVSKKRSKVSRKRSRISKKRSKVSRKRSRVSRNKRGGSKSRLRLPSLRSNSSTDVGDSETVSLTRKKILPPVGTPDRINPLAALNFLVDLTKVMREATSNRTDQIRLIMISKRDEAKALFSERNVGGWANKIFEQIGMTRSEKAEAESVSHSLDQADANFIRGLIEGVDQDFLNSKPQNELQTVGELLTSNIIRGKISLDTVQLLSSILEHARSFLDLNNGDNNRFIEDIDNFREGILLKMELDQKADERAARRDEHLSASSTPKMVVQRPTTTRGIMMGMQNEAEEEDWENKTHANHPQREARRPLPLHPADQKALVRASEARRQGRRTKLAANAFQIRRK